MPSAKYRNSGAGGLCDVRRALTPMLLSICRRFSMARVLTAAPRLPMSWWLQVAVELHALAVQREPVVRVEGEAADPERRRVGVDDGAAHRDGRDDRVHVRRRQRPELGVGHVTVWVTVAVLPAATGWPAAVPRRPGAVGVERCWPASTDWTLVPSFCTVTEMSTVALESRPSASSPPCRCRRHGPGSRSSARCVDRCRSPSTSGCSAAWLLTRTASTFEAPTLALAVEVAFKGREPVRAGADLGAVQIDGAVHVDAVELDEDVLTRGRGGQGEGLSIPADAAVEVSAAGRRPASSG